MKTFFTLAALAGNAVAFPAIAEQIVKRASDASHEVPTELTERQAFPDPNVGFNPKLQYVSTSGKHKFVAPNLNVDARGPCPGLNAMANHGYIPHNGIGTDADFIKGTYEVFGMGADLSGFLTVLGSTVDGNGLEWSIGGPNKALPPALPGLGEPQGISGSHNKYESDVSPSRGDLYKYGNDYELQMSQFQQLYDMGQANGDTYDLDLLNAFRSSRFDNSVATNPYFFNGPFTGVLVAPAAFEFIYRFMSNKSAAHPQGHLNGAVLRSFFGVAKHRDGSLHVQPGRERIPENWYKRAVGDEYTIPLLNADTVLAAKRFPKFLTVGGNTGKVNSLTGVSPANLTGGAYDSQSLLKGNNLACFSMSFAQQLAPDAIKCSNALGDVEAQLAKFDKQLAASTAGLDCKPLAKASMKQFGQFPGYSKLKCQSGTY